MNVKIAFLHKDLEEKNYINQLEAFIELGSEKNVCKLVYSLSNLRKLLNNHMESLIKAILSYGF